MSRVLGKFFRKVDSRAWPRLRKTEPSHSVVHIRRYSTELSELKFARVRE